MSINVKKTGENIKRLAEERGLSASQLADAIVGISSVQAVYKWYRGENLPTIDCMLELQSVLKLESVNQLLVCDNIEETEK